MQLISHLSAEAVTHDTVARSGMNKELQQHNCFVVYVKGCGTLEFLSVCISYEYVVENVT